MRRNILPFLFEAFFCVKCDCPTGFPPPEAARASGPGVPKDMYGRREAKKPRAVRVYKWQRAQSRGASDGHRSREERDVDAPESSHAGWGNNTMERPFIPRGLRGKAIGLYFRDRNRKKKAQQQQQPHLEILLAPKREAQIRRLLRSIHGEDLPLCMSSHQEAVVKVEDTDDYIPRKVKKEVVDDSQNSDHKIGLSTETVKTDSDNIKTQVKDAEGDEGSDVVDFTNDDYFENFDDALLITPSDPVKKYNHISDSRFKHAFLQSITGNLQANLERSMTFQPALVKDSILDRSLKEDLLKKEQTDKRYQAMLTFRRKLPSYGKRHAIVDAIASNQVLVINGETGCGKTTQVAQFILDDFIMREEGSLCHIVCTQPRRISAMSVAQRVADERAEPLGLSSGYQIRVENVLPRKKGSILFCTTGILLQWMQSNPALTQVSHLILDEIHERDTVSDFVITVLKDVIPKRPDLRVILMSATLDAEQFSQYYDNCPCLNIPGFTYPVEEYYLEDVLQITNFPFKPTQSFETGWRKYLKNRMKMKKLEEYQNLIDPYIRNISQEGRYSSAVLEALRHPDSEELNLKLIVALIKQICQTRDDGAILVFLPGWDKISTLNKLMAECSYFHSSRFLIIPLHSLMPTVIQKSVFDRPPPGVRKIVIATNIAETSITIDDVVFVIDGGRIKMNNFDSEANIVTLQEEWVSLANARQRRGRAGRVQPGICYHLYTRAREMTFANYLLPEMLRTRLDQVILQIKILQLGKVQSFLQRVMDPPDPKAVEVSLKLLQDMNALDEDENLTPLGYHLAKLPLDPQTGKMILMAAIFSCVDPVLSIAASLTFKDAFVIPLGREEEVFLKKKELSGGMKSDHLVVAEALKRWQQAAETGHDRSFCWQYFLSGNTLSILRDMKRQFAEHLFSMNFLDSPNTSSQSANLNSENMSLVKAIICAGLYPNVAVIQSVKQIRKTQMVRKRIITPEDGKVYLHPRSINDKEKVFESPFLLYYLKMKSTAIYLHDTTMVHPLPLLFFGEGIKYNCDSEVISVNTFNFKCRESTAVIIKELRKCLDGLLEYKITHPGVIDWKANSEEGAILRAIIELITHEDNQMMLVAEEGDDADFSD